MPNANKNETPIIAPQLKILSFLTRRKHLVDHQGRFAYYIVHLESVEMLDPHFVTTFQNYLKTSLEMRNTRNSCSSISFEFGKN